MERGIKMRRNEEKSYLPDGIMINILSRATAKSVLRCRLVCPGWRCLTSDPIFIDLHLRNLRNRPPCILVANPTDLHLRNRSTNGLDLFSLDSKRPETLSTIHRFPFYSGKFSQGVSLLLSHDGIVVLGENLRYSSHSQPKFFILNPVFPECVTINLTTRSPFPMMIYGVYFHPLLKEYCSLWKIVENEPHYGRKLRTQYKILILSSTPSMKTVTNPFSDRFDRHYGETLLIDNYLYWLLGPQLDRGRSFLDRLNNIDRSDIMEFDIIREEYTVIPCPIPSNTDCSRCQTKLLNIGGIPSFLLVLMTEVTIWRLEDRASKSWTSSKYAFNVGICPCLEPHNEDQELASPIAVVDGKLTLESEGTLFVCNLMEGTMKKYRRNYSSKAMFLSHQISLVSLKNCKSTILIDKDGEVVRQTRACSRLVEIA